jgi:hypothetical protein
MASKWIYILIVVAFCSTACHKNNMTSKDFFEHYQSNKSSFTKVVETEQLTFTLSFLPKQSMVLTEMSGNDKTDLSLYKSIASKYDSAFYFKLTIEPRNGESFKQVIKTKEQYTNANHYLLTNFVKDFKIKMGAFEFASILAATENDVLLNNKIVASLSINKPLELEKMNEDVVVIYTDNLLNNGIIKFKFKIKDIQSITNIQII